MLEAIQIFSSPFFGSSSLLWLRKIMGGEGKGNFHQVKAIMVLWIAEKVKNEQWYCNIDKLCGYLWQFTCTCTCVLALVWHAVGKFFFALTNTPKKFEEISMRMICYKVATMCERPSVLKKFFTDFKFYFMYLNYGSFMIKSLSLSFVRNQFLAIMQDTKIFSIFIWLFLILRKFSVLIYGFFAPMVATFKYRNDRHV